MPYFKTENGNAENIKYDNTKSVKEAIDEIKNNQAASVTFDNTDTGLNATNVQDVVTEVNGKLDTEEEFVNECTIVSKTSNHVTLNGSEYIQRVTYTIPGWEMFKIGTMNKKYAPKRSMMFYTNARNIETARIYYIGVYITPNGDVYLYNAATGDEITFSQIGFSFSWDV